MTTPADPTPATLGRVVATERRPNTPHEFHFWTALDAPVGIGTIVRVETERPVSGVLPRFYGVVTEAFGYTDLQTPLHDVLGADGDPGQSAFAPTDRTEIRLYTAAVLRHVPEEPLQPVPMGTVHLASEADVQVALRMDSYVGGESPRGIPVGLYRAGGTQAAVQLDADFLLGPEAAHLSISGVSGLATKTSAVEWLLASIFAHFPAAKGGVAAVCFNVKGPDLCFLDQPAPDLADEDRAMYETLGVPAEPFADVRYFAPWTARGTQLATLRSNDALQENVQPLTWGLRETLQYAEVLLNRDDIDAKADALIDFIKERVLDQPFTDALLERAHEVRSFADLEQWFRAVLRAMEQRNADVWRTHHIATIRKVRNRLSNISTRCRGLVTDDGTMSDLPFGAFADRTVYVVDVANL
ncbi:MAG: ATP-binding protein, partial [Gemmatimonadota bacterium]|nr:ATP-binding protein [Gemmatimonadota bacterium]